MRMRAIVARVISSAAVIVLGVGLAGAPANASGEVCTAGGCAGEAWFEPDGEHFYIRDHQGDGHSVVVRYVRHDICSSITGKCQVNLAWHHYGQYHGVHDHNMNIAEGVKVEWNVALVSTAVKRSSGTPAPAR